MDEDKVNEILNSMGSDYKPPSTTDDEWGNWADTIEIKLNKQGQILVGLTIGLGVTLLLTSLQGKVVINLVKGHKMVIDAINTLSGAVAGDVSNQHSTKSYTEPQGRVDETKVTPVDEQEVEELRRIMIESDQGPAFGEE